MLRFIIIYIKFLVLVTRFFNIYGLDKSTSDYSGVISIMNTKFLNHSTFTFYGDGEQTRDFVYIDDLINAISIVLNTTLTDGFIYNVGTGTQTNLKLF